MFTQFFEFGCCCRYHALIFENKKLVGLPDRKFNAKSISTNLKWQKPKPRKLVCLFYVGEYLAVSSHIASDVIENLKWIYLEKEKWFCSAAFFLHNYFWCLRTYLSFYFLCQYSFKVNILGLFLLTVGKPSRESFSFVIIC